MREVKPDIASYARMRIFGIGGGGSHVVSRMFSLGPLETVECIVFNTDVQDLARVKAHRKFHIGQNATGGLGAGMDPELGRLAAEEDSMLIERALTGSDFVVLVAGFGGGTGSGALPVAGEIAAKLGVLTLAVVTKPFSFEGAERARIAEDGIAKLRSSVDAFLVIPNDRLSLFLDTAKGLEESFLAVDDILRKHILSLYELISLPGLINVDFADLRSVFRNAGPVFLGMGQASGEGALKKAVEESLHPPLLEFSIKGATQILCEFSGGRDLPLDEVRETVALITGGVHTDARVLFGVRQDPNLRKDEVKVILIASGFLQVGLPFVSAHSEAAQERNHRAVTSEEKQVVRPNPILDAERLENLEYRPSPQRQQDDDGSIFDIPAFLRRKKR